MQTSPSSTDAHTSAPSGRLLTRELHCGGIGSVLYKRVLQSVWSRPCGLAYRSLSVLLVGQDALVHLGRRQCWYHCVVGAPPVRRRPAARSIFLSTISGVSHDWGFGRDVWTRCLRTYGYSTISRYTVVVPLVVRSSSCYRRDVRVFVQLVVGHKLTLCLRS